MPRLPRLTGSEMVRFLQRQGFSIVRIHGSHYDLASGDIHISVPVHSSRMGETGTLRAILRDVELSPQEFLRRWAE